MAHNDVGVTDESTADHPAADLDVIVVDPDDIVAVARRKKRDETDQRTHGLRVKPPFEGERRARTYVMQSKAEYYPPEMSPKPLHLDAGAFLVGHLAGDRHPDYRTEWDYPDRTVEKARFRDEFGARTEDGDNRPLTDDEQAEWEEWWETAVEMCEDRVRHALVDEVTLARPHTTEETTAKVRYETTDETA